ncbi:hypothetical protein AcV5_001604 [Taiwanofungus camphoratus]|nr:hypothetical protein AcV5_001604 [Antrodia cinnamomea]KAI0922377.1 hypothetical protein AcV7_005924 [Antrodia cinnamomea]
MAINIPHTLMVRLSEMDRAVVTGLSAAELREWVLMKTQEAEQYLLCLRSIQNSTAPINRLPNELLVDIFSNVKGSSRYMAWIKLTHVCRSWRELALATPLLWTTVSVEKGLPFVHACLNRSGDVPVDIAARGYVTDVLPLINTIFPHACHIRTLKFWALSEHATDTLISEFKTPMPKLEELTVHGHSGKTSNPFLFDPTDDQFPRLRVLSLKRVVIPGTSSILEGLVRLELSNFFDNSTASVDNLLVMIHACRQLEDLTVVDHGRSLLANVAEVNHRRILSLPKLQRLRLSTTAINVSTLLAHLIIPTHASINITCSLDIIDTTTNTITAVLPRNRTGLANLTEVRALYLFVTSNIFRLRAFDCAGPLSSKRLDVELDCQQTLDLSSLLPSAFCELTEIFVASPVVDVQLLGDQHFMTQNHWQAALARLPLLECLEVGFRGGTKSLFRTLRSSPGNATEGLLCPYLRRLYVGGAELDKETIDVMTECLDFRATNGKKLESFALRNLSSKTCLRDDAVDVIKSMVDVFDGR